MRVGMTAVLLVFFFQAEDGIRDTSVTGVQTCALPICLLGASLAADSEAAQLKPGGQLEVGGTIRSEERRVGKGWSIGGLPRETDNKIGGASSRGRENSWVATGGGRATQSADLSV